MLTVSPLNSEPFLVWVLVHLFRGHYIWGPIREPQSPGYGRRPQPKAPMSSNKDRAESCAHKVLAVSSGKHQAARGLVEASQSGGPSWGGWAAEENVRSGVARHSGQRWSGGSDSVWVGQYATVIKALGDCSVWPLYVFRLCYIWAVSVC